MYLVPKYGLNNLFSLKYAFPTVSSGTKYILPPYMFFSLNSPYISKSDVFSLYLMNMDLKKTGECRLHLSNEIPIKDIYTFGLLKGNQLNSLFSEKYYCKSTVLIRSIY